VNLELGFLVQKSDEVVVFHHFFEKIYRLFVGKIDEQVRIELLYPRVIFNKFVVVKQLFTLDKLDAGNVVALVFKVIANIVQDDIGPLDARVQFQINVGFEARDASVHALAF